MTMWVRSSKLRLLISAGAISSVASGAIAQDQDGIAIGLDFESSLRVNDNFNLEPTPTQSTTLFDNKLTFGIESSTPIQRLSLSAEALLRYSDDPSIDRDLSFDDPDLSIRYNRAGVAANFGGYANLRRRKLNTVTVFENPLDPDITDLVVDQGTRETRGVGFDLELNSAGPFGLTFSGDHAKTRYRDQTDPRLFDIETNSADIAAFMQLSQVVIARLTYGVQDYNADDADQTDRRSQEVALGVTYAINPVWELDAQIGDQSIRTVATSAGTTDRTDNVVGALRLQRLLRTGSATLSFDNDVTPDGRRSTLRLARAYETPTVQLDTSIGATRGPSGDHDLVAALTARYDTRSGSLTASFSQDFQTGALGSDFRSNRLGLGYQTALTPTSRLALGLDYARTSDAGDGSIEEIETTNLRVAYGIDLTSDWGLQTGFIRRHVDAEATGSAQSNEFFVTLQRSFSFNP